VPIRSVEYGEESVRVVVHGQLTRPDVELIRGGLSRNSGGLPVVVDLRNSPAPDAGALLALAGVLREAEASVEVIGISQTCERLLVHLGVALALVKKPRT
jgi:hypothetical protein